jgi:hypothetical protein
VHKADNLTNFMCLFLGASSSWNPQACTGIAILQAVPFINITTMMTPKRTKLEGHVARMGLVIDAHKFWSYILRPRDHLQDIGVHEIILLKLDSTKGRGRVLDG